MEELAKEIIGLARDHILIALRFLDVALSNLSWKAVGQVGFIATDGVAVSYDSQYILQQYKEEPQRIPRTLLHLLFHCIFYHPYQYAKVEQDLWDLATDLAVENVIVELKLSFVTLDTDLELQNKLRIWS